MILIPFIVILVLALVFFFFVEEDLKRTNYEKGEKKDRVDGDIQGTKDRVHIRQNFQATDNIHNSMHSLFDHR